MSSTHLEIPIDKKSFKRIEFEDKCCGKKMVELKDLPQLIPDVINGSIWICGECGSYFEFKEGQMDEEELESYKENYPDEFGIKDEEVDGDED